MTKKQLFKSFFNTGIAQILPAIFAIIFLIVIATLIAALTFNPIHPPSMNNQNYTPPYSDLLLLAGLCIIVFILLSGLVAFLLSSLHFIRARRGYDYKKISQGMGYLNWGWLLLSLFTAIMFSLFALKIVTDIGYQYF